MRGLQLIGLLDDTLNLSELLGLTANQSSLSSTWTWFGMTEQTNIGNTYVNLDQLTVSGLLGNLDRRPRRPSWRPWTRPSLLSGLGLGGRAEQSERHRFPHSTSSRHLKSPPGYPPRRAITNFRWAALLDILAAMPTIAIGPLSSLKVSVMRSRRSAHRTRNQWESCRSGLRDSRRNTDLRLWRRTSTRARLVRWRQRERPLPDRNRGDVTRGYIPADS